MHAGCHSAYILRSLQHNQCYRHCFCQLLACQSSADWCQIWQVFASITSVIQCDKQNGCLKCSWPGTSGHLYSTQHRIDIDICTRHLGPVCGHCNVWQRLSTCTFNQTTLRVWPTGHDHSCCQFLLKSAHRQNHICHWQVDAQRANNSSNPCKQ